MSHRSLRAGYVLVVRDASPAGAVFGAYMTDAPHPNPHYYGTGECFLWRASVLSRPSLQQAPVATSDGLAGLPPPPSADTTHIGRSTTLRGEKTSSALSSSAAGSNTSGGGGGLLVPIPSSRRSTPDPIRFKAFPYSGVNDYMIFCETGFLSLGGG